MRPIHNNGGTPPQHHNTPQQFEAQILSKRSAMIDFNLEYIKSLDVFDELPIGCYSPMHDAHLFWVEDTDYHNSTLHSLRAPACPACHEVKLVMMYKEKYDALLIAHESRTQRGDPLYAWCNGCAIAVAVYVKDVVNEKREFITVRMHEQTINATLTTIDKQIRTVGRVYKRLLKQQHDMMLRRGDSVKKQRDAIGRMK